MSARRILIITVAIIWTVTSVICICTLEKQNNELQNKIEFYEEVMYDFGIDEFIHYPELFYDKCYVEQVIVHNCMWAFDLED